MQDQSAGLVSRIQVIEEQPLHARAEEYARLHDELARRLDAPVGKIANESKE